MTNLEYIRNNIIEKGESDCPICKNGSFQPIGSPKIRKEALGWKCDNCGVSYRRTPKD